jgi:hypothetical protein
MLTKAGDQDGLVTDRIIRDQPRAEFGLAAGRTRSPAVSIGGRMLGLVREGHESLAIVGIPVASRALRQLRQSKL